MAKKSLLEKAAYDGLLKSVSKLASDIPLNTAKSPGWSGHDIPNFPNPDSTGLFFDSGTDHWIVIATIQEAKAIVAKLAFMSVEDILKQTSEFESQG